MVFAAPTGKFVWHFVQIHTCPRFVHACCGTHAFSGGGSNPPPGVCTCASLKPQIWRDCSFAQCTESTPCMRCWRPRIGSTSTCGPPLRLEPGFSSSPACLGHRPLLVGAGFVAWALAPPSSSFGRQLRSRSSDGVSGPLLQPAAFQLGTRGKGKFDGSTHLWPGPSRRAPGPAFGQLCADRARPPSR